MTDQPLTHDHPPMETCPPECPTLVIVKSSAAFECTDCDYTSDEIGDTHSHTDDSLAPEPTIAEQVAAAKEKISPAKKTAAKKTTAKKAATTPAERRAPRRGDNRASGKPAATEEGEKSADELTTPPEEKVLDVEREEWFRAPGFQRMKTAWEGEDKRQMDRVQNVIDTTVLEIFADAYAVMSDLYDLVREPMVAEGGEIQTDPHGFTMWARNPLTGSYVEDWSMLTTRQREDFLFRITTSLFDWEQRSADLWTKAMFSKGMFVERFSIQYDAPIAGTIDDRNAKGNVEAAEERYFALMNSAVSRKADALVRTMTNLQLRLKDVLGQ